MITCRKLALYLTGENKLLINSNIKPIYKVLAYESLYDFNGYCLRKQLGAEGKKEDIWYWTYFYNDRLYYFNNLDITKTYWHYDKFKYFIFFDALDFLIEKENYLVFNPLYEFKSL